MPTKTRTVITDSLQFSPLKYLGPGLPFLMQILRMYTATV